jgi:DNA mismatch repair protein MutS
MNTKRLSLFLLTSVISLNCLAENQDSSIGALYVQANCGNSQEAAVAEKQEGVFAWINEICKLPTPKKDILSQADAYTLAFGFSEQPLSDIINNTGIKKLELLSGISHPSTNLFSITYKPYLQTILGKTTFLSLLCTPTTDIRTLQERQAAIQFLADHQELHQQIQTILHNMHTAEKSMLTYWHSKPPIDDNFAKMLYFGKWFNKLNNTAMLEFTSSASYLLAGAGITFGAVLPIIVDSFFTGRSWSEAFVWKNISSSAKIGTAIFTALYGWVGFIQFSIFKNNHDATVHLQKLLIDVASYVQNAKRLRLLINRNPELLTLMPELQEIMLLTSSKYHTADYCKLLSMLDTNTFKGEASFFSIIGRVLAANKLMQDENVHRQFDGVLRATGLLDTYSAIATMMTTHEEKGAHYCFAQYTNDGPYLHANNFWNPFIDADKVVANSVDMGSTGKNNIILTGPNTGGKTTTIKALVFALLMAQTFGVAPADEFVCSPFSKLNCYLSITDNIAGEESLFKAEVMRAKELVMGIKSLAQNEYAFTIIDEIFSGTSPQEGEQAAYLFAQQLNDLRNSCTIIATHYPKLTELENISGYKNCHVEVIRHEDGSRKRTFKLCAGPSYLNIAMDLLKEEGLL